LVERQTNAKAAGASWRDAASKKPAKNRLSTAADRIMALRDGPSMH